MTDLATSQRGRDDLRARARIVASALEWLGTPYHHLGDVKGAGVDCAMFLVRVFVDSGLVPAFDPRPYPTDWHLHRGEERYLGAVLDRAREVDRPGPGDIALYRFGRTLSHSALVIAWPRVIHAQARVGCVLADARRDEPLASRTPRFFSLWGAGPKEPRSDREADALSNKAEES